MQRRGVRTCRGGYFSFEPSWFISKAQCYPYIHPASPSVMRVYRKGCITNSSLFIQGHAILSSLYALPFYDFDLRASHARTLLPAALASVPFGFVLVRVRVRQRRGGGFWLGVPKRRSNGVLSSTQKETQEGTKSGSKISF